MGKENSIFSNVKTKKVAILIALLIVLSSGSSFLSAYSMNMFGGSVLFSSDTPTGFGISLERIKGPDMVENKPQIAMGLASRCDIGFTSLDKNGFYTNILLGAGSTIMINKYFGIALYLGPTTFFYFGNEEGTNKTKATGGLGIGGGADLILTFGYPSFLIKAGAFAEYQFIFSKKRPTVLGVDVSVGFAY